MRPLDQEEDASGGTEHEYQCCEVGLNRVTERGAAKLLENLRIELFIKGIPFLSQTTYQRTLEISIRGQTEGFNSTNEE